MTNVIELESVESEHTRKLLAHKILSARTDISYAELLEILKIGGFNYFSSENENDLETAILELKMLGINYKITRKETPKKEESSIPVIPKTPTQKIQIPQTRPITAVNSEDRTPHNIHHIHDIEAETVAIKIESDNKKKNIFSIIITVIILVVIVAVLNILSKNKPQYKLEENQNYIETLVSTSTQANNSEETKQNTNTQKKSTGNQTPQTQRETQINEALDSADNACKEGMFDAEKFYRVAISFNKYNMKAWRGLLNCFEKKRDNRKLSEIRKEMQEAFGESVFQISDIISGYGEIESMSSQDKICRLSYFRYSNTELGAAERELFAIGRNIAALRSYEKAMIVAKGINNNTYTVSILFEEFPETFEEFQKMSVVNKVGL